ncbi:MAG: DUF899 family protein [Melioribacteraceae bacterium]|nr:DUF899 family protein [Melioribacteraceae bacterium]
MRIEIEQLEKEIADKKTRLKELKKSEPHKLVANYEFVRSDGSSVSLLDLFGDKEELIVIQNMGKSCSYCTMWADGFNGVYHYLAHKAPFFLASPDSPEVQTALAEERDWKFPMISTQDNTFKQDLGFYIDGQIYPGVSVFRKTLEGGIYLVANDFFGPGDDYSSPWHLFDLLPSGSEGFNPNAVRKVMK